jgi:hypothetical protein
MASLCAWKSSSVNLAACARRPAEWVEKKAMTMKIKEELNKILVDLFFIDTLTIYYEKKTNRKSDLNRV